MLAHTLMCSYSDRKVFFFVEPMNWRWIRCRFWHGMTAFNSPLTNCRYLGSHWQQIVAPLQHGINLSVNSHCFRTQIPLLPPVFQSKTQYLQTSRRLKLNWLLLPERIWRLFWWIPYMHSWMTSWSLILYQEAPTMTMMLQQRRWSGNGRWSCHRQWLHGVGYIHADFRTMLPRSVSM